MWLPPPAPSCAGIFVLGEGRTQPEGYPCGVDPDGLDDLTFFRTLARSGARALLIGRRALILLGAPVMTADYDLWIHIDDIELLNRAFEAVDHAPNRSASEARARGRYVIENGERIDVVVAREMQGAPEAALTFDEAWGRRRELTIAHDVSVSIPDVPDLIKTKRWGSRAKDLADIQFLEALARGERP